MVELTTVVMAGRQRAETRGRLAPETDFAQFREPAQLLAGRRLGVLNGRLRAIRFLAQDGI